MDKNLFYINQENYQIGNKEYHCHIVNGIAGRGKTTYWLAYLFDRFKNTGKKFLYLRRSDIEIELALNMGLLPSLRNAYGDRFDWIQDEKHRSNIISIQVDNKWHECAYYTTLNNVKGVQIEDCDVVLFDEYVAKSRGKYKGGEYGIHEPAIFFRLMETIFRRREFWIIMLGNNDTLTNPYNEQLNIPFTTRYYKNRNRDLFYYFDTSEDTVKEKQDSILGKLSKNTEYENYTTQNIAMDSIDESFISDRPLHSTMVYNIKYLSTKITVWRDNHGILYFTDKYKFNPAYPVISVTTSDMSIDTNFIKDCNGQMITWSIMYSHGMVRFSSQKIGSMFLLISKLVTQ